MPDNVGYTEGSGVKVACRDVTYSGEVTKAQAVGLVTFDGPDDAKTVNDVNESNPLPMVANQSDDLLRIMLSRMLKMMESNAIVDQQQRQRVTLDAISANLNLQGVGVVTTVATVNNVAAQSTLAGMDREMYINIARNTCANSIRSQLTFG